ncbi:MAG TPA: hypothetical protein PKI92_03455 [Candidatus Woesebacteria bacterium]|nr:hypothetical protein [Candidatus Woesebacteria bacterium]HPR99807.1 hypothetical protein [Candidatus Woesebacteria bacterium]
MKDGQIEYQPEKNPGEIKIKKHDYHGRSITVVGMEHHELFDTRMPDDWQRVIGGVMDNNQGATVFLEYAIPDLKRHLLAEPGVGLLAKIWLKEENIINFFGELGRMAGERGMRIAVADPASNSSYALAEFSDEIKWKKKQQEVGDNYIPMNGHKTPITKMEMDTPNAIDARRLLSSMAVMQHCLEEDGDAVIISPPAHTERINNYIERQIEAEGNGEGGNHDDKNKLKEYLKNNRFNRNIRYYTPNTFPGYYRVEGMVMEKNYQEAQLAISQLNAEHPSVRGKIIFHLLDLVTKGNGGVIERNAEKLLSKYVSTADNWQFQKKSKIKSDIQSTDRRE